MAVRLLSNMFRTQIQSLLRTITSKFQVTTTTVKGFMYKLTPNHCYNVRKVSQGYISANGASRNIMVELSDIINTKFPVSEGDEIILSDIMQNADVGHRVTMTFLFATQTKGLNRSDAIIVSIPAEMIYFDDINPSIHDDATSCFGVNGP